MFYPQKYSLLEWKQKGIAETHAIYQYEPKEPENPITALIRAFKAGNSEIGQALGQVMGEYALKMKRIDVIVPIPGDPERNKTRGFNPPFILAFEISRITGIPMKEVISRTSCSRAYHTKKSILEPCYSATSITGNILLVDDVIATGKTKRICANLLKKAGAKSITVLTIAKTNEKRWSRQLKFSF